MTDPGDRRLIAGSMGPERAPYRKDPAEPHWFEPEHVRDPAAARSRMAALVAAGADVLVAPAWLTHRRALLPIGETRRARAWTTAAVRVAREAVEVGLELRAVAAERAAEAADRDGRPTPPSLQRPSVLVAGPLPALDGPEPDTGRLLPREAATERDHRTLAGHLAEAEVDLLLVEPTVAVASARQATEAAAETGLPAWVAAVVEGMESRLPSGEPLASWSATVRAGGAVEILVQPVGAAFGPPALARLRESGEPRVGVTAAVPAGMDEGVLRRVASAWLADGAGHLGILDGAGPGAVAAFRAALDDVEGVRLAAARESHERWWSQVRRAARRAPGGRAAWIGPRRPDDPPLPAGFAWLVAATTELSSIPVGELRLVVAPGTAPAVDLVRLAALLAPGGILLATTPVVTPDLGEDLRILDATAQDGHTVLLARREP